MNYTERNELNKDIKEAYNNAVIPLYKKWNRFKSSIVREQFYYWVCVNHHEKTLDLLNKRDKRSSRYNKVKQELNELKIKDQLENFTEGLK